MKTQKHPDTCLETGGVEDHGAVVGSAVGPVDTKKLNSTRSYTLRQAR